MGTSSYFGGPGNNQPLLPPWADGVDDDDTFDQEQTDQRPSSEIDGGNDKKPDDQARQPPKPTVNFSPLQQHIRQFATGNIGGGVGRRLLNTYVRGSGNSRNAARASSAGRTTTAGIGRFARNIAIYGVEEALERLNLGDSIGQSVNTILSRVTEVLLSNATSVDDKEAARTATYETLCAMYERYDQDTEDITVLDAMSLDEVSEFVTISVSNYIYERVMQVVERTFEGGELEHDKLLEMELELRGFIQADVEREFKNINIADFDWNTAESEQMVMQLYERAHEIWEALQV